MTLEQEKDRIRRCTAALYQASRTVRILTGIAWSPKVKEGFFATNAQQLPQVDYPKFDASGPLALVAEARRDIGESTIDSWLARQATSIETGARLLSACGTPAFLELSGELYGTPTGALRDQLNTPYDLACRFDTMIESFSHVDLGAPAAACHLAQAVAEDMRSAVQKMFGAQAPRVEIVDELSANALAGPKRIRIRRSACFTDKDIRQLVNHEAHIHVATSMNGMAQPDLTILAAGHPGTTRTQEGLAVFAEFITGSMDLDRMRRLADRVLAIQMAVEGANFIDVYRFFLERIGSEEQAFENARRVFRGGNVAGGIPFTKDVVYLDGLLRVHNFLRVIATTGRADCLRLLFCGKLDLDDIPALYELTQMGLCRAPKYLPPWANDLRFLLCYLTYSSFLNRVNLDALKAHYQDMLKDVPQRQPAIVTQVLE
ncbi:MAG TPA: flavohemoglobin expression-modulating QEGLA motif protein [Woeseiaceae bacterium]|nr:flavohemoglobin expression-modulating QEGLA motif protein [Woeseiaceae bacterium]